MSDRTGPALAACLIVRDEASNLPGCLAALDGVVDELHVHDTGSTDATPRLAVQAGAVVTHGSWTGDFAAARNEAQDGWHADWVLAVDADERYTGDPGELRRFLAGCDADVVAVEVDNASDEIAYTHRPPRLYRPDAVRWQGRVHERLVAADGGTPRTAVAPRTAIVLRHEGYAQRDRRMAKAMRNAELAQRALDEPAASTDRAFIARTLLDLGRSLIAAERRQAAVDTLETLRELFPGTPEWFEGTDFLVRLVMAAGMDDVGLVLVEQLRAAGAPGAYCDWLAAQALAQLGDFHAAATLLAGVTEVVDTAGRRHDPRVLEEMRTLVGRLHPAA